MATPRQALLFDALNWDCAEATSALYGRDGDQNRSRVTISAACWLVAESAVARLDLGDLHRDKPAKSIVKGTGRFEPKRQ